MMVSDEQVIRQRHAQGASVFTSTEVGFLLDRLHDARADGEAAARTLAEIGARLDWMAEAARGEPVSDFALSFGEVRMAADLRHERDAYKDANEQWAGQWAGASTRHDKLVEAVLAVIHYKGHCPECSHAEDEPHCTRCRLGAALAAQNTK